MEWRVLYDRREPCGVTPTSNSCSALVKNGVRGLGITICVYFYLHHHTYPKWEALECSISTSLHLGRVGRGLLRLLWIFFWFNHGGAFFDYGKLGGGARLEHEPVSRHKDWNRYLVSGCPPTLTWQKSNGKSAQRGH